MASFELRSSICDGHVKIFARAIELASKISRDILVEFKAEQMKVCAKSDLSLVKFIFTNDFFADYRCDKRHRCYVDARALLKPARLMVRLGGSEKSAQAIKVKCMVEDELNNRIILQILSKAEVALLTYRIYINDLTPLQMEAMSAINRRIDYWRIEVSPKEDQKGQYLASALKDCPSIMDSITIRYSPSEVRFTASASPLSPHHGATSEFVHGRDDYIEFNIKESLNITLPLRYLKLYIAFVESNKVQVIPTFTFEGFGLPAHFTYKNPLFESQFVSSTSIDYVPETISAYIDSTLNIFYDQIDPILDQELDPERDDYEEELRQYRERYLAEVQQEADRLAREILTSLINDMDNQLKLKHEESASNHYDSSSGDARDVDAAIIALIQMVAEYECQVSQSIQIPTRAYPTGAINDLEMNEDDPHDPDDMDVDYSTDSESGFW